MASAAGPFPIFYTPDVHNFYVKQKREFHFNQKSDNDFLMFLLDTAVRVISIVQHLAPVIEAVSDASADVDDIEDRSPVNTLNSSSVNASGFMDVESSTPTLSEELGQITQEIISQQLSQPSYPSLPPPDPVSPMSVAPMMRELMQSRNTILEAPSSTLVMQTNCQRSSQPTALLESSIGAQASADNSSSLTPNVPATQLPTYAQSSENLSTVLPHATQPIAEAPSTDEVKREQPVPEVIEIKEEMDESNNQRLSTDLIPTDTLQQLMSSISGAEDSSGLQNFVPTANLSSLPPSFLDRNSHNPLSMVGSLNSIDGPGPSGIHVPNISESMLNNIKEAGLDVSTIKGQANPKKSDEGCKCEFCGKVFRGVGRAAGANLKRHIKTIHLRSTIYVCPVCHKTFNRYSNLKRHLPRHDAS